MHNPNHSGQLPEETTIYQIRVRGHLGGHWMAMFEDMVIRREANGETTITGPVVDQAALHGLLRKVRNLGLPLISIIRISPNDPVGRGSGRHVSPHDE